MGQKISLISEQLGFSTRLREVLTVRGFNFDVDEKTNKTTATLDALCQYFKNTYPYLDISRTMIWSYLYKNKLPLIPTTISMCRILDVNLEWLVCGTGRMFGHKKTMSSNAAALITIVDKLDKYQQLLIINAAAKLLQHQTEKKPTGVDINRIIDGILTDNN